MGHMERWPDTKHRPTGSLARIRSKGVEHSTQTGIYIRTFQKQVKSFDFNDLDPELRHR